MREAMHEDWYAMSKNRVLESMVPVREEQQKIKELITQNYVQLDELFKTSPSLSPPWRQSPLRVRLSSSLEQLNF